MKIFLDFDDCLFDSVIVEGKFWKSLRSLYRQGGWSEELIEMTRKNFSYTSFGNAPTYSPEKHWALLNAAQLSTNMETVREITKQFLEDLARFVFPDVVPFLKQFQKEELVLLTYGDSRFQEAKVRGAELSPFFGEVLITENVSKALVIDEYLSNNGILKDETIFFVDDKDGYFEETKKLSYTVTTILIDRNDALEKKFADYRAKDFYEIMRIIGAKK